MQLLPLIYSLCKKLPAEEKYNLISQIKRAGLSISNNLAESAARKSKVEKNRFFEIVRSSVVEVDNCLVACITLNFLTSEDTEEIILRVVELFKLITGLIDSNSK